MRFPRGRLLLSSALCLFALLPMQAPAQLGISETGVSKADKAFANELAPGLLRDMESASIVGRRGENKAVRQFASAVLDHRTKAHGELRALAKKTRLLLPDRLGAHQQMQINGLQKLSGRALDQQFLRLIAQTNYLHFFALELKNGALRVDPEVKAFARKQRPVIRADMGERASFLRTNINFPQFPPAAQSWPISSDRGRSMTFQLVEPCHQGSPFFYSTQCLLS